MVLLVQSDMQDSLVVLNDRHQLSQYNSYQQSQVEEVADKGGQTDINNVVSCLYD